MHSQTFFTLLSDQKSINLVLTKILNPFNLPQGSRNICWYEKDGLFPVLVWRGVRVDIPGGIMMLYGSEIKKKNARHESYLKYMHLGLHWIVMKTKSLNVLYEHPSPPPSPTSPYRKDKIRTFALYEKKRNATKLLLVDHTNCNEKSIYMKLYEYQKVLIKGCFFIEESR